MDKMWSLKLIPYNFYYFQLFCETIWLMIGYVGKIDEMYYDWYFLIVVIDSETNFLSLVNVAVDYY